MVVLMVKIIEIVLFDAEEFIQQLGNQLDILFGAVSPGVKDDDLTGLLVESKQAVIDKYLKKGILRLNGKGGNQHNVVTSFERDNAADLLQIFRELTLAAEASPDCVVNGIVDIIFILKAGLVQGLVFEYAEHIHMCLFRKERSNMIHILIGQIIFEVGDRDVCLWQIAFVYIAYNQIIIIQIDSENIAVFTQIYLINVFLKAFCDTVSAELGEFETISGYDQNFIFL